MNSLMNKYIKHVKFGRGLIIEEEIGKITVEFTAQIGNKKFLFPDALEQYLSFEDALLQEESLVMLENKKQLIAEENEKKLLEQKRLEEERLLEELEQKKKYKKAAKGIKRTVKKESKPVEVDA